MRRGFDPRGPHRGKMTHLLQQVWRFIIAHTTQRGIVHDLDDDRELDGEVTSPSVAAEVATLSPPPDFATPSELEILAAEVGIQVIKRKLPSLVIDDDGYVVGENTVV